MPRIGKESLAELKRALAANEAIKIAESLLALPFIPGDQRGLARRATARLHGIADTETDLDDPKGFPQPETTAKISDPFLRKLRLQAGELQRRLNRNTTPRRRR